MRAWIGALAAVTLMAVGCGGDDDVAAGDAGDQTSGDDRDEYVDALAYSWDVDAENRATGEENRCRAEAYVEVLGLDVLRATVSPDEIRAAPGKNVVDFGIAIDEQQGRAVYEAEGRCADVRGQVVRSTGEILRDDFDAAVDDACLDENLDESTLETITIQIYRHGERAQRSPEVAELYVDWLGACADLREAIVASLTASMVEQGSLPAEAVRCVDVGIDADLARRAWIDLSIGLAQSPAKDELLTIVQGCGGTAPGSPGG
jgi:hypothetical protein